MSIKYMIKKSLGFISRSALMLAALVFVQPVAQAGTDTWNQLSSGNASGSWNTAANPPWSAGALPGSGDTADFNTLNITADSTVTLDGNQSINAILFGDTTTTSAANWFLNSGTPSTSTLTLSGTTPTITVNALGTSKTATIGAIIAGSAGLTKSGAGTLTLAGVNTYTGTTYVNAGYVGLANANSLGATGTGNDTVVAAGAEIMVNLGSTAENFTISGTGIGNNGVLNFGNSGRIMSGTITLAGNSLIWGRACSLNNAINLQAYTLTTQKNNADIDNWSAIISGTGGLTINGRGATSQLKLTGPNTYSGPTTLTQGIITAGVASVPGVSGALGLNSAVSLANTASVALDITGFNTQIGSLTGGGTTGGNVTLGAATLTVGGDNTSPAAFAGVISGTGGNLTKIGSGTLTLNNTETYTGTTTINAGTLALGASGALNAASSVSIGAGGTLDVSGLGASATYTLGSSASLTASGTGTTVGTTAATIKGGSSGTVSLGSRPITLTYDGANQALHISQGILSLGGNQFTVVTGSQLGNGVYTLVSAGTISGGSTVNSTALYTGGSGLVPGATGVVSISGNNVILTVTVSGLAITITSVTSSGNPSIYGNSVDFTATLQTNSVTATEATGNIVFSVDGTPTATNAVASGTATYTTSTLSVGSHTILASYSGDASYNASSGSLTQTNNAAATKLVITSTAVTTTAGVASSTITVERQNGSSSPVTTDPSITVTLSSDSTGTTTFTPASLTIINGASSATFTYTDTKVGTPTLTAASGGLTSATQQETVTVSTPAKLAFTTQPNGGAAGTAWITQPAVTVQDAYGNTVTDGSSSVALAIAASTPTSGGPGTLSGTTPVSSSSGVATFSGLSIDKSGVGYKLTATSDGLTTTNSATFNITPGAAASLSVTGFPTSQPKGQASSVTVTAKDAYGNTATNYTGTVTLTSSDGAATLPGNYTYTSANGGVYSFSGVTFNTMGTKSIIATDTVTGSITGTQSGIVITKVPDKMTFSTPGSYTWTAPGGVTSINLLVVAGGGAGGRGGAAGGGGAGGLKYYGTEAGAIASSYTVVPGTTYTVTVGAGGAYSGYNNGGNSTFDTVTATGGGAGGNNWSFGTLPGAAGGSGGGGGIGGWSSQTGGVTSPAGQGYAGGDSTIVNAQEGSAGGGGGGAGAAGGISSYKTGGNGGIGLTYAISGLSVTYAGGGGGATFGGPTYIGLIQGQGGTGYLNAGGGGMAAYPNGVNAGTSGQNGTVIVSYTLPPQGTLIIFF